MVWYEFTDSSGDVRRSPGFEVQGDTPTTAPEPGEPATASESLSDNGSTVEPTTFGSEPSSVISTDGLPPAPIDSMESDPSLSDGAADGSTSGTETAGTAGSTEESPNAAA